MENRVIKFRAWNREEMVSPDYVDRDGVAYWKENSILTSSKIVMQWTGLKDKHGKEIYEGDIVKKNDPIYWHNAVGGDEPEPPDAEDMNFYRGGTAEVVYGKYGVFMQDIDCGEWAFNGPEGREWLPEELEVIGNRFQHPHLLNQTEKI